MMKWDNIFSVRDFLTLDFWRSFFMGRIYPIIVCVLIFLGNVTALEYYFNLLITASAITALFVTDSVKPIIVTVCAYIYQISLPHAPAYPTYSDFFFSGWRKPVSIIILAAVAISFSFFLVKKLLQKSPRLKYSSCLIFTAIFCLALLFNGAFSSDWTAGNLIFAFLNIIVYFFWLLMLTVGFNEKETSREIGEYFAYISMLMAFLIVSELAFLYIGKGVITDGQIDKTSVALGWGIWNIIGTSLAVLIAPIFYGAMTMKYPIIYFAAATLAYVGSVFSMSRNALIFSTLAYAASMCIACFFGKRKKEFRIIALCLISVLIIFAVIFWGKISALLADYFERGLSDNGRYDLWSLALETFASAFLFGNGFYGFHTDAVFEFGNVPRMAHNTVLELMAATGVLGTLSYIFYRVRTAIPFFKRPSLMKTMLGISVLTLLFGALLDNFMFNLHPVLYYTVIIAIVSMAEGEEN